VALGGAGLDNLQHVLPYLAGLLAGINALPDASIPVIVDDGASLGMVGAETLLEGLLVVIGALDKRLASHVVLHILLGRVESSVVAAARGGMDETTGDTFDEERVVDLKLDSVLKGLVAFLEHGVEAFCLGHSSREAVENETVHRCENPGQ
jgi:hypothetical protein